MKCFWCGRLDTGHMRQCPSCGRDLNWSRILRGVLKKRDRTVSDDRHAPSEPIVWR